jgi:hypothetical protein
MGISDQKYVATTTFRKNGAAVSTPTWIVGLDDARVGFWTSSASGKYKRRSSSIPSAISDGANFRTETSG